MTSGESGHRNAAGTQTDMSEIRRGTTHFGYQEVPVEA
jgi:hypothetical protein